MNMRTTPTYYPESPKELLSNIDKIPLEKAFELLENVRRWPMNSTLLAEIKLAETELLQMKTEWIQYVTWALQIMLTKLEKGKSLPLAAIVQQFTEAGKVGNPEIRSANDESSFELAA